MKLCRFCIENVLESKEPWDYHHKSYHALKESCQWDAVNQPVRESKEKKKEQCLFCSTLYADVEKFAPKLKERRYAAVWPICRWNIRSLAKIRESLETVVVTFRYVPPVRDVDIEELKGSELPTRTFLFFPEEDLEPLPTVSELGYSTNPADNGGNQMRSWIKNCDMNHEDCMKRRKSTPSSKHFVPTRLLDIGGTPGDHIRVIETGTSVKSPYCSLSHCWGKIHLQRLLKENQINFMRVGVPWRDFPRNFQEAIEIARALDIKYIWIDSLCIIQDSKPDWDHEASRMHLVYRNSYCNIAIADSPDSSKGAFRKRNPEDITPVRYRPLDDSPFFQEKAWVVVPENLWEKELIESPLYTRGWVFQERMLAPRILHFAHKQIFWDCPSLSACETLPSGLPQPMDSVAGPDRHWRARLQEPEDSKEPLAGATDQSMPAFWKTVVHKYTSCDLTKGEDKLKAVWGIAKLIRDIMGVEYGDGLWEENLEDHLAWRVAECKDPKDLNVQNAVPKFPSWSWASMNGTIIVPDRLTDAPHYKVTDHKGRPLRLDLKGVKRFVRARMPVRGQTDTDAELHRHKVHAKEEPPALIERKSFPRSSSHEETDRNDEPEFHSKSIPIQGHVGQGQLKHDDVRSIWTLQINGIDRVDIEAFPDTMPDNKVEWARSRYFVVLAAKRGVKSPGLNRGGVQKNQRTLGLAIIEEEGEELKDDSLYYEGHGILMRYTRDHHFRRTGAFKFRDVSQKVFKSFQKTDEWGTLPPELYDPETGRKFWLD